MIQRIQTIFLLLVILLFGVYFLIPVYSISIIDSKSIANSAYFPYALGKLPLMMGAMGLLAFIALVTIFMYRDRKKQMLLCRVGLIGSVLIVAGIFGFSEFFSGAFQNTMHSPSIKFAYGSYFSELFVFFFFLAGLKIRKDENMVRAADRLR